MNPRVQLPLDQAREQFPTYFLQLQTRIYTLPNFPRRYSSPDQARVQFSTRLHNCEQEYTPLRISWQYSSPNTARVQFSTHLHNCEQEYTPLQILWQYSSPLRIYTDDLGETTFKAVKQLWTFIEIVNNWRKSPKPKMVNCWESCSWAWGRRR